MARLTLAQIANPDMAGYLQSLGYTYGGETDDGSVRYMDSEGNLVSPENLEDVFSEQGLAEYAANQRRLQGVIDLADYSNPGSLAEYAKKGYASPEAYLSQLYGGGERVGDYFVLPQEGDARAAQMVGTPIVYNSPGLLKEFITNAALLAGAGYGLNALTTGGFGGLGAGAGGGLTEAQIAEIVAAEGGYSALPSAGMGGTAAGAGAGAAGGLELGGAAPWWETAALNTPSEIAAGTMGGVSGALDAALPLSAASAGGLAAPVSGGLNLVDFINTGALPGTTPTTPPALPGAAATAPAAGTALSRLLDGSATSADYAQLASGLITGVGGAVAANQQSNAFEDLSNKYMAMGAPYRNLLEQSYQPGFSMANQPDFQNALDVGAQAAARATSAKVGNPVDNPGAYAEMQKDITGSLALPQLNTYRSQLGSFGQLGTNTAGTAGAAAINAQGGGWEALGSGIEDILNPRKRYDQQIGGVLSQLASLNTGRSF